MSMQARIVGSFVAVLAASALGAAQTVAPPTQGSGAQPAYEQQIVTVEGCLERERAPEEVARQLAGDPDRAAVYVLVDTDVRSRIDTKPGTAPADDPRVLGPAGIQNERLGLPVEGGADEATDAAGEQRASPAVEGAPTPAADRYIVQGLPDDRLKPFAGQRVAMTGQFEPPVAAVDPDVAAAEPVGTAGVEERWPGNLPRFVATSVKPVPGICVPKP
jgi:hypothetical protein